MNSKHTIGNAAVKIIDFINDVQLFPITMIMLDKHLPINVDVNANCDSVTSPDGKLPSFVAMMDGCFTMINFC